MKRSSLIFPGIVLVLGCGGSSSPQDACEDCTSEPDTEAVDGLDEPEDGTDAEDVSDVVDVEEEDSCPWPPYTDRPDWTSVDTGYATGAAWADIDGDGLLDLVVAHGNDMDPGPVMVYVARSDGTLPEAATWQSDETAYYAHLACGDVDGDGWTDVAVAVFLDDDGDSPGGAALYLNTGGGLPTVPTWESAERFHSFSVALGDIDNDGDLDLAAAAGEPYFHDPLPNLLFINDAGTFEEPAAWVSGPSRHSMDVAFLDADGNGALDLVFANATSPHTIYLNTGSGIGASLPSTSPGWEAVGEPFDGNSIDFGDVDGDGHLDIVISDGDYWLEGRGTVSLYCGPDFHRCWECADGPMFQSAVALVDLDCDEDLDLVAGSWWGYTRFYRNEDGLETVPSATTSVETVVEAFAFHDLDGGAAWEETFTAPGPLVELPPDCHVLATSTAAAMGYRYLTVPGEEPVTVTCLRSDALDLIVSEWTEDQGNQLYVHRF